MQADFNEYVIQRDKEFADYLKTQWTAYKPDAPIEPPEKPKPEEIPAYNKPPEREEVKNRI